MQLACRSKLMRALTIERVRKTCSGASSGPRKDRGPLGRISARRCRSAGLSFRCLSCFFFPLRFSLAADFIIPSPHRNYSIRKKKKKQEEEFCDEFHLVDLRVYDNCKKVVAGCDQIFNLAADMGGMG